MIIYYFLQRSSSNNIHWCCKWQADWCSIDRSWGHCPRTSLEHISSPFMDPTLHVPRRRCSVVRSPTERRIFSLRAAYAINFALLISDLSTQHYSDNRHTQPSAHAGNEQWDPEKLLHLDHPTGCSRKRSVPPKTIKHMRIINWLSN